MLKAESPLEALLARQLRAVGINDYTREFKFAPGRRFRFDFAWWTQRVAVECEGGIWTGGAHTRGKHYESDCEKYNLAALLGWRVFRFTSGMIKSGKAIETIERALEP